MAGIFAKMSEPRAEIAMSINCVIGRHGFLGGALARRFPNGVSSIPTRETKTLFYMAGHTHPTFEKNPQFEINRTLSDFKLCLDECQKNDAMLVYTSSALVYEQRTTFSTFKEMLEEIAHASPVKTLGLRIFPVYGPGEQTTVISQWCRQMLNGERPTVYGDGTQTRDFIFIEDVVDQILQLANVPCSRVVDIGTGISTSFNEIIDTINRYLGTTLKPKYVPRPEGYSDGIACSNPLPFKVSVETGIRRIIECLKKEQSARSFRPAEMLTSVQ